MPGRPYDSESISVTYAGEKIPGLVRGKSVTVFGIVTGSEEVTFILTGVKHKIPSMEAYAVIIGD